MHLSSTSARVAVLGMKGGAGNLWSIARAKIAWAIYSRLMCVGWSHDVYKSCRHVYCSSCMRISVGWCIARGMKSTNWNDFSWRLGREYHERFRPQDHLLMSRLETIVWYCLTNIVATRRLTRASLDAIDCAIRSPLPLAVRYKYQNQAAQWKKHLKIVM